MTSGIKQVAKRGACGVQRKEEPNTKKFDNEIQRSKKLLLKRKPYSKDGGNQQVIKEQ